MDNDYRYAPVAGNDLGYLWLLSREPTMPENIKTAYLLKAGAIGYDTSNLVWTKQNGN